MKRLLLGMACVFILALSAFYMKSFAQTTEHAATEQTRQHSTKPTNANDGERKFAIHCGRCHNPPQDLSPKAAPAVLRHMRVRAMLTEEDEKAILNYIAP